MTTRLSDLGVSTTGNITADGYYIGNGALLTGISGGGNIDLTAVNSNIIPAANIAYSLGNATNQWLDLWVSNATIYLNSIPLSVGNTGALQFNGNDIVTSGPNVVNTGNVQTTGNVIGGNVAISSGGSLTFADGSVQTSAYGDANVIALLPTYTGNIAASTVTTANVIAPIQHTGGTPGYNLLVQAGYYDYGDIAAQGGTLYLQSGNALSGSPGEVVVGVGTNNWTFDTAGNLTLPGNSEISINYANGDPYGGYPSGNSGAVQINWLGDFSNQGGTPGDTYTTMQFDGDGLLDINGNTAYQPRVDYTPYITVNTPRVESTDFGIVAGPGLTVVGYDDTYNTPRSAYMSVQDQATATQQWDFGILGNGSNNFSVQNRTANTVPLMIDTDDNVSVVGNINGNYFIGDGSLLTNINAANISGGYGNANVFSYLGSNSNVAISTTGSVTAFNIAAAGLISSAGNVRGANFNTDGNVSAADVLASGNVSASGNVTGANFNTNGDISAIGNIYASNIFDASLSTSANIATGNIAVNGIVSASGSVVGVNVFSAGLVTATGNIRGANFNTNGNVSAQGNVNAAQFFNGSGQYLDLTTMNQGNIGGSGVGGSLGNINTAGNIVFTAYAGAINWAGLANGTPVSSMNFSQYQRVDIVGADLNVYGNITAESGNFFIGDGGYLSNITGANVSGIVPFANIVTNPSQPNITSVGTLTSLTANSVNINGQLTANGNAQFNQDVYFAGNVTLPGNIIQISGNSGTFFGNAVTGFGAFYAGLPAGYTPLINEVAQFADNYNGYTQITHQNLNGGDQATGDFVITADNGTDLINHIDLGIAGSGYNGVLANNSLGTSLFPNDGYLYTRGDVSGGNLVIGSNQANGVVRIIANGVSNIADVVATFSTDGLSLSGGISTAGVASPAPSISGFSFSGVAVSASGNVTGGNISTAGSVTGGNISTAGNVTGGNISTAGNVTGGNISTAGLVTGGNISTAGNVTGGNISTAGNVSGNYIIGNGSLLTNLPAPTITYDNTSNGYMDLMTYDGNIKYISTATIEPASGNINSSGNISAVGNVYGDYATFSDITLNDLAANAILYTDANRNVFNTDFNYDPNTQTMSGGNISITDNITANNITATSNVTAIGNVYAGNLVTANTTINGGVFTTGDVSATGNVNSGNVNAVGNVNSGNVNSIKFNGVLDGNLVGSTVALPTGKNNPPQFIISSGDGLADGKNGLELIIRSGNSNESSGTEAIGGTITIQAGTGNAGTTQGAINIGPLGGTVNLGRINYNTIVGGSLYVTENFGANNQIVISTNNSVAGVGYADIFSMTNTGNAVTNPNKYVRLDSIGELQIVNSAYSAVIFNLADSGDLSVAGNVAGDYFIGNGSLLTNLPAPAPVIDTVTSAATITPTGSSTQYNVTALAVSANFAAPSGSPVDGQKLTIRILDNGTPQTLSWNAIYQTIGTTLPTTTVANKYTYVGVIYNAQDTTWDVVSVAQQA
jgi:hypothetical protein